MNLTSEIFMLGYIMFYIMNCDKQKIKVVSENNRIKYEFFILASKPDEKSFYESYFQPYQIENDIFDIIIHRLICSFYQKIK